MQKRNLLLGLVIILIITSVFYFHKSNVAIPYYSIDKIDLNKSRGFNVSIHIQDKLSDGDLKLVASKVKEDIHAVSDIGKVFFYLPEMTIDNGAWAVVEYNPEIEVRVIGLSIKSESEVKKELVRLDDYIGLWVDNFNEGDVVIRIRNDKQLGIVKELISPTDPKPSEYAVKLIRETRKGKTVYIDTENEMQQYYIVESNGDLSAYDKDGFIATYKKLK
jgi:hypothetical protein